MVDYHVHTNFSDGVADYQTIIDLAIEKGLKTIAITDHFDPFDDNLSNKNVTEDELAQHFDNIRNYSKDKQIKVICGIETCAGSDGNIRISQRVRDMCGLIITSPHYFDYDCEIKQGEFFNDEYWEAYKQKTLAMALGDGDILGHSEAYLPRKLMIPSGVKYSFEEGLKLCRDIADRYFDEPYIEMLGNNLAKSGKACELHGGSSTPREWVIESMNRKGVIFSIGSDTHLTSFLGRTEWAYRMVEKYGLKLFTED